MFACIHGPDAASLADSFSPFIEMVEQQTAVFSITTRQLGRLKSIQAAVAATVEAAILAARNLPTIPSSLRVKKRVRWAKNPKERRRS